MSASIGLAIAGGPGEALTAMTADLILQAADAAMYTVKRRGKAGLAIAPPNPTPTELRQRRPDDRRVGGRLAARQAPALGWRRATRRQPGPLRGHLAADRGGPAVGLPRAGPATGRRQLRHRRGSRRRRHRADGYAVAPFATGLAGPRFMAVAPDGTLLVAERGADRVVALPDHDATARRTSPSWSATATTAPTRWPSLRRDPLRGRHRHALRGRAGPGPPRAVTTRDPRPAAGGAHSTRTVAVLPDGRLLVSVGSSCNVCWERTPRVRTSSSPVRTDRTPAS